MIASACDTHVHVYDSRFPVAPEAVLRPPDATLDEYRDVQRTLATERVVLVQPTTYGLDNALHLQAMAEIGEACRGIMVVDADTSTGELRRLTDLGVRGARFHMLPGGAVSWDDLDAVVANIAPFGWHVQVQLDGRELPDRLDRLRRLPVPLVIDHVGRFMPAVEADSRAFASLLDLVDDGAWVKLSAPYESSTTGPPDYADVSILVGELLARSAGRMLWASNWPHPGHDDPPSPIELVELRDRWLPTVEHRRRVLVDNPAELYGF